MSGLPPRQPRVRRPLEATVKDGTLMKTLAERLKRDVALEKAEGDVGPQSEVSEVEIVVVLGPDGVPQIADTVEAAPETVRIDISEATDNRGKRGV